MATYANLALVEALGASAASGSALELRLPYAQLAEEYQLQRTLQHQKARKVHQRRLTAEELAQHLAAARARKAKLRQSPLAG